MHRARELSTRWYAWTEEKAQRERVFLSGGKKSRGSIPTAALSTLSVCVKACHAPEGRRQRTSSLMISVVECVGTQAADDAALTPRERASATRRREK